MRNAIHLTCRCSTVELTAFGDAIMSTECMCTSCRRAAEILEALPGAPVLRERTGGTRMEVFRKDRVTCRKGSAHLREFRLDDKTRTRRVVAACCHTPMFLDFTDGHWVDLYGLLWPDGVLPQLQFRTMASDLDDPSMLPDDVPNLKTHSVGFFAQLFGSWIAMGFRRPKIDFVPGELVIPA